MQLICLGCRIVLVRDTSTNPSMTTAANPVFGRDVSLDATNYEARLCPQLGGARRAGEDHTSRAQMGSVYAGGLGRSGQLGEGTDESSGSDHEDSDSGHSSYSLSEVSGGLSERRRGLSDVTSDSDCAYNENATAGTELHPIPDVRGSITRVINPISGTRFAIAHSKECGDIYVQTQLLTASLTVGESGTLSVVPRPRQCQGLCSSLIGSVVPCMYERKHAALLLLHSATHVSIASTLVLSSHTCLHNIRPIASALKPHMSP